MRRSASNTYEIVPTWNTNLNIGDKLEGTYTSKDEFNGNFGPTTKYIVTTPDGSKFGVYGSASLNRQFSNIPEGSYVWIEYTGETTSSNGKVVKTYTVDFDDEYQA